MPKLPKLPRLPDPPELTVGTAANQGGVTVLPLFPTRAVRCADYELGADAIARGELAVREIGGGSTHQLRAHNRGRQRVLLLDGDHLLGARQNRIVTSTALIGGGRDVVVPVSCVEQGRWQGRSSQFDGTSHVASPGLRRITRRSVTQSLLRGGQRVADQAQIWDHIAHQQRTLDVRSATLALSHSFVARAADIGAIADQLRYPDGATGVAIGVGDELVSVDAFDNPRTCAHYWRRLIEGAALDSLGAPRRTAGIGGGEVAQLLAALRAAPWRRVAAVDDGEELRAQAGPAAAALLVVDGVVVHFGAATAAAVDLQLAVMRHDLPASLAARYEITARIGVGGTKEVFRATDKRGGADVAIARMPSVDREAYDREVALLCRIEGSHVPRIVESCVDVHGDAYLVMELCDGPNLAQMVGGGSLAVAAAAPILVAFARGLRAIHDACVLHRDIKLENAMLVGGAGGPVLKILDFGLSQRAPMATTAVGAMPASGTLPYMAREAIHGRRVDARTDVYAFGVCCYRMLVGEFPVPPRDHESPLEYLSRAREATADTSLLPAALPVAVRELIARMLDGDRDRRPYMPEVVAVLERAFDAAPIAAAIASSIRSSVAGSSRPATRGLAIERAYRVALSVALPEHVLVDSCAEAPFIALIPDAWGVATHVRAIAPNGALRWTRRLDGHLVTGIRADLDGDGVREIYLAGRDSVVGLGRAGEIRFTRALASPRVPTLIGLTDAAGSRLHYGRLVVDGHTLDAATGEDRGGLAFAYRGDGRELVAADDPRGLAYHGLALQAFCGDHGTGAAIVHHPGARSFQIAQLEDTRAGRIQLGVYGPGGARLHHLAVADSRVDTGDTAAIARIYQRRAPLFGPQHAPLAVLADHGFAVVIVPLLDPDDSVAPALVGFELPSGRELWRCPRELPGGRALLADLRGDGRPQLVVGDGQTLVGYDPWTGEPSQPIICKGLPVAFGDPLATGFAHLITASSDGVELWRGPRCRPGAMKWAGARGDLWRTGTLRSNGWPFGPV